MWLFSLTVTAILLIVTPSAFASTYVAVDDEVYVLLGRLEAEGVIESGLLSTRPLSRKEVIRLIEEAERNSRDREFIQAIIKSLKEKVKDDSADDTKYIKPLEHIYAGYIYTDSDNQALNYQNDGSVYKKGSNLMAGISGRAELRRFSLYINPEFISSEDAPALTIKRAYAVIGFWGLEITAGKEGAWWGPGRHGSILMSNNAKALTALRLENPRPVLLPWVFRHLGPFRFVFFVSRLEEDRRDVPEPYLWGLRLNFKPHPCLEIGLSRTAMLGGGGRSEGPGTWLKSFIVMEENDRGGVGDQRAGADIKITLPFKWQPLQIYGEVAGEDEAGGLPSKKAYLTGAYLPGVFKLKRVDFRAEYANNHVEAFPDVWYRHGVYTSGYTYKGRIIGHHMGTDSKDLFMELVYLIPERDGKISISYNREDHNLSGQIRERKDEGSIVAVIALTGDLSVEAVYRHGSIKNSGNMPNKKDSINMITTAVRYRF